MLKFIYGTMGSAKTAHALITKFGYEEKKIEVLLICPSTCVAGGTVKLASSIGISAFAHAFAKTESILDYVKSEVCTATVVIADDAQFFTPEQVYELRCLADAGYTVLCYGLKTNFKTQLFAGSKRLLELADCEEELESRCHCGAKATVNARLNPDGIIAHSGEEILLGGNDRYEAMCFRCWRTRKKGWGTD